MSRVPNLEGRQGRSGETVKQQKQQRYIIISMFREFPKGGIFARGNGVLVGTAQRIGTVSPEKLNLKGLFVSVVRNAKANPKSAV